MTRPAPSEDEELGGLYRVVRRVVAARVNDPDDRDDLVQEAIARVLAKGPAAPPTEREAYAIVTAQNVVADHWRRLGTAQRNLARLFSRGHDADPLEEVVLTEEAASLRTALRTLPPSERDALLAHEIDGTSTAEVGRARNTSPGAVAVALSATRARLRVRYLLAQHHIDLPSTQCRDVLDAISANDRRRQARLDAGGHLDECATCAALARPLRERRRSLLPATIGAGALGAVWRWVTETARQHPIATAGLAVVVGVASWSVVDPGGSTPAASPPALPAAPAPTTTAPITAAPRSPAPATAAPTTAAPGTAVPPSPAPGPAPPLVLADGTDVLAATAAGSLTPLIGTTATANGLLVLEVPADEGFWAGTLAAPVWVQLVGDGESRQTVTAGSRISGQALIVGHAQGYAASQGISDDRLDGQGAHLELAIDGFTLT